MKCHLILVLRGAISTPPREPRHHVDHTSRMSIVRVGNEVYTICLNVSMAGPRATAQDIVSNVWKIPCLTDIPDVYEMVVSAIQQAIESDNWTCSQLSAMSLAKEYFSNVEKF